MTNPDAEAPAGRRLGIRRKAASSGQMTRSPCQQSVENPVSRVSSSVEKPFAPPVEINDIEPTGSRP
jgi:hypothetical protein